MKRLQIDTPGLQETKFPHTMTDRKTSNERKTLFPASAINGQKSLTMQLEKLSNKDEPII